MATFGIMAVMFATLCSPVLRLAIAVTFALPAAFAGYSLVSGITRDAVPSEVWRQLFCIAGGMFVGCSALARLADPSIFGQDR